MGIKQKRFPYPDDSFEIPIWLWHGGDWDDWNKFYYKIENEHVESTPELKATLDSLLHQTSFPDSIQLDDVLRNKEDWTYWSLYFDLSEKEFLRLDIRKDGLVRYQRHFVDAPEDWIPLNQVPDEFYLSIYDKTNYLTNKKNDFS